MIVFPMRGAHAGDLVMAMPAIGHALERGPVTVAGISPRYYAPFRRLPVTFRFEAPAGQVLQPRWTPTGHRTDDWLRCLGPDARPARIALPLFGEENARSMLPGTGWLVISPWSEFAPKRWLGERWRAVAAFAASQGFRIALVGPPQAAALCREIAGGIHLDLVGYDTPNTWPAFLQRADAVISTDSAPVHVADALGVPVIGLYGVSQVAEYGPYWRREFCLEAAGMDGITAADVCAMLQRLWATTRNGDLSSHFNGFDAQPAPRSWVGE